MYRVTDISPPTLALVRKTPLISVRLSVWVMIILVKVLMDEVVPITKCSPQQALNVNLEVTKAKNTEGVI